MKPRAREILRDSAFGRKFLITDQIGSYYMTQGWSNLRPLAPDWRDTIRMGDVLRIGADGTFRVVRYCNYKQNGILVGVSFIIRHCSWTGRCHTFLGRGDLRSAGYRKTGIRIRLNGEFDAKMAAEISNHGRKQIDCCDVRGIA